MHPIRLQMIEQLISGQCPILSLPQEVPLPPLSNSEIAPKNMGRFDMPTFERMKRLQAKLRKLRAKFTAQVTVIKQLKENLIKQLDTAISSFEARLNPKSRNGKASYPKRTAFLK